MIKKETTRASRILWEKNAFVEKSRNAHDMVAFPKYRHAPKKIDAGIRPRNQNATEITVPNVYAKQTPGE